MSMFSTFSTLVQSTFTRATSLVDSGGKAIDTLNVKADNWHKETVRCDTEDTILRVAEHHNAIEARLNADEKLKAQYAKLRAEW